MLLSLSVSRPRNRGRTSPSLRRTAASPRRGRQWLGLSVVQKPSGRLHRRRLVRAALANDGCPQNRRLRPSALSRTTRLFPIARARHASSGSATNDGSHPMAFAAAETNSRAGPGNPPPGNGRHGSGAAHCAIVPRPSCASSASGSRRRMSLSLHAGRKGVRWRTDGSWPRPRCRPGCAHRSASHGQ